MTDLLLRGVVHVQILAQDVPKVRPDNNAPGAAMFQQIINMVGWFALAMAVLSILVGGLSWAASRMSNNPKAQSGAGRVVMTGATLAFIVAIASFAVTVAFGFGDQVE